MDGVGDVCDPDPNDPNVCGDRDGDMVDDCAPPPDAGVLDTGVLDAAPDASPLDADAPDIGAQDTGASDSGAQDAGAQDADPPDLGAVTDAGAVAADSGTSAADAGRRPEDDEGCGCTQTAARPHSRTWALLGVLGLFVLRRSRRSRAQG